MGITHDKGITHDHGMPSHWQPYQVKLVDDRWVSFRDVVVHTIRMGDVEDPDLFVAQPIYEWQQTEAGKFVMEHAVEPPWWVRTVDAATYGFEFAIMARMKESDQTFYKLKYVGTND